MADKIHEVAIHNLQRDGSGNYSVHVGNGAVTVTKTAERLIDDLHRLYSRRASKAYGRFSEKTEIYPTSVFLTRYRNGEIDFSALTKDLMKVLAKEAQARAASAGGHVFFAHFNRDGKEYLLVAIVTDKVSAALTASQDLKDVEHLDVEGFRFAGRVGLTSWEAGDDRYVGFLKGKGNVSEYFKEFLGCETTSLGRAETASLVRAIKDFTERAGFDQERREKFLQKAMSICDRDARLQQTVDFTKLANELHPEEPEALIDVLADPERGLSDGYVAHRQALKLFVNFKRRTADWSVEFDRSALHSGKVKYNAEERVLVLHNVPDDMHAELKEEFVDG